MCEFLFYFILFSNHEKQEALSMFNIVEFPTGMLEAENIATMFCKDETPFANLCSYIVFAMAGKSPQQFNGVRTMCNLQFYSTI